MGRHLEEATLGRDSHWPCWNGDPSRLFVRKAGYHYGWDWGPTLMTSACNLAAPPIDGRTQLGGDQVLIRRPRTLLQLGPFDLCGSNATKSESWICTATALTRSSLPEAGADPAYSHSWPRATVSVDLVPKLSLSWQTSETAVHLSLTVRLVSPRGVKLRQASFTSREFAEAEWTLDSDDIELWWTHDQGAQPLYEVQLDFVDEVRAPMNAWTVARRAAFSVTPVFPQRNGQVLDSAARKVGFRRIDIVRAPLSNGENGHSFAFVLNNIPLFLGGSNWIPMDSFLTNGAKARYRSFLKMAKDGHQTMVRVWGGGLYEEEVFYETCVSGLSSRRHGTLFTVLKAHRTSSACLSGKISCLHAVRTLLSWTTSGATSSKRRLSKSSGSEVTPASPSSRATTRTSQSFGCCWLISSGPIWRLIGVCTCSQIAEAEKLQYDPEDREGM